MNSRLGKNARKVPRDRRNDITALGPQSKSVLVSSFEFYGCYLCVSNVSDKPETTKPLSSSSPTPAVTLNSPPRSSRAANQSSKHHYRIIPYQRSQQYYKDRCQIENVQRNEGTVSGGSPSAHLADLRVTAQPPVTSTVSPSIFKPLKYSSCRSSPLGPHQHSLPDRPVFPPSNPKPDLYRQVLKKSICRIRRIGKKLEDAEKFA